MNASDMSIKFCQLSIKLHLSFKRDCRSENVCILIKNQYILMEKWYNQIEWDDSIYSTQHALR